MSLCVPWAAKIIMWVLWAPRTTTVLSLTPSVPVEIERCTSLQSTKFQIRPLCSIQDQVKTKISNTETFLEVWNRAVVRTTDSFQSFGNYSSYPVSIGGVWWSRCWLMVRASNTYWLTLIPLSLWGVRWGNAHRSRIGNQSSVIRDTGLKYSYGCEYSFSKLVLK